MEHQSALSDPRRDFFDQEAPGWDDLGEDYTQCEKFQFWWNEVALQTGEAVLEIGCGTGRVLPWFCQAAGENGRVEALDISEGMLERARARCQGLPINFHHGQARQMHFEPESFDRIFLINTFPHLQPRAEAIKELRRILKAEGQLHITHFCGRKFINSLHEEAGEAVKEDRLPPACNLAELLESCGFETMQCEEEDEYYNVRVRKVG